MLTPAVPAQEAEERFRRKVTLISFVCGLIVIYIHTYNLETYGIGPDAVGLARLVYLVESACKKTVFEAAIPSFFFISGYLFFRRFSLDRLAEKYRSRIKSLVIPYLIWVALHYLVYSVLLWLPFLSGVINYSRVSFSLTGLLRSYLSGYHLWYVRNLIVFAAFAPVFYLLLRDVRGLPTGLAVLLALCLNRHFALIPLLRGVEPYSIAAWLAINHGSWSQVRSRALSCAGFAFVLVMFAASFRWYGVWTEAPLFVAVWLALDVFSFSRPWPWWMHIGFFTYAAHKLVLETLEKLVLLLFGRNALAAGLDFVFMPLFVFALLAAVARLLQRYTPHLWEVLCGGRG